MKIIKIFINAYKSGSIDKELRLKLFLLLRVGIGLDQDLLGVVFLNVSVSISILNHKLNDRDDLISKASKTIYLRKTSLRSRRSALIILAFLLFYLHKCNLF